MIEKQKYLVIHCGSLRQLKQIHALLVSIGQTNRLQNELLRRLLSLSPNPNNVSPYLEQLLAFSPTLHASSWGFAVRFFSANRHFATAFAVYVHILRLGLSPTSLALSSSLKACANIRHLSGGFSLHSHLRKLGFASSLHVMTSLLHFYSKTGHTNTARALFDEMPHRNVVTWNSMLAAFIRAGNLDHARRLFHDTPAKDAVSWNSMLTGYARAGDMDRAVRLFHRMPDRNSASWNAVISGYASRADMDSARRFFNAMPLPNDVSLLTMISGYSKLGDVVSARSIFFDSTSDRGLFTYNAMIACYEQNGWPKEALELFDRMVDPEGFNLRPDKMTLTSVISACSQLGYLGFGLQVEAYMKSHGLRMDDHLANAFIDLYAKCGDVEKAYELFRGLRNKDLVSYSAMISGFGVNGKASDAIRLFREMIDDAEITPNLVTYKGLLTAYNHAGLVEEGYECLNSMKEQGLLPSADHYGIVVDLLGRSGRLEEAYEVIKGIPVEVEAHAGVWGALLVACRLHGSVELGEIAARKCFELRPEKVGYRSLLANVYAAAERWDDAGRLRRSAVGDEKTPGCSWTESDFEISFKGKRQS